MFLTLIGTMVLSLTKPPSWIRVENRPPQKRGTKLETNLPKVRRPEFFYLGPPNSLSKMDFSNVCDFHMNKG